MHSTKRAIGKLGTIATLVLGGLLCAASADANDGNRGERINDQLDFLAFLAVISGDPYLAYMLDRSGDRIESRYARHDDRKARHRRGTHRRHHHHFAGCGHSDLRARVNHHDPYDRRRHYRRNHLRHERRHH